MTQSRPALLETGISLRQERWPSAAVFALGWVSGGVALAYEVLWTRELLNLLGSTTQASVSTLAAFMTGLTLGAWVGGRSSARLRRPVWLYAACEGGLAALGLAVPLLLHYWPAIGSGPVGWSIAAATALLFVPTFLMGIALPALAAAMQGYGADRPKHVARLYGVNTLGGSLAALTVGFGSLPVYGLAASEKATVIVSLAAALAAAALGFARPAPGPMADPVAAPPADTSPPREAPVAIALFLAGAAALGYEILWTRMLVLILGSSTNAFTEMLGLYLLGVAIGGFWIGRVVDRLRAPSIAYQHLQLGVAATALLGIALFGSLPELALFGFANLGTSAGSIAAVGGLLTAIIIVPPTILIGASLPVAARLLGRRLPRRGRELGTALAWITAGNVAGVLAAAFMIIPAVGLHWGVMMLAALNLAAAGALWIPERRGGQKAGLFVPAAVLATGLLFVVIPPWNVAVMTSGVFREAPAYLALLGGARHLERAFTAYRTIYYREGSEAVVAVFDRPTLQGTPDTVLTIDGKVDASTGADMSTEILSGKLSFLFRPDARRALVIGLASGITVGALATHSLEKIDVVEIEPAVVQASRAFDEVSGAPLGDPRVRVIIEDGRRYLQAAATPRYDIVVSEPSNPWLSMSARLFTHEFFKLVRRRLTPGGLLVQWVPLYGLSTPEFEALLRTIVDVFPHLAVFQVAQGDLAVMASPAPLALHQSGLARLFHGFAAPGLLRSGIHTPAGLLSRWITDGRGLRSVLRPGPLNTDDNGLLEFGSPWYIFAGTNAANLSLVNRAAGASLLARRLVQALPATEDAAKLVVDVASRDLKSGRLGLARQLAEALKAEGYRREGDLLSGDIASAEGDFREAERIWSRHSGVAFSVRRARLALSAGRAVEAAHLFEMAGKANLSPEDTVLYSLSLTDTGKAGEALRALQKIQPKPNSLAAILASLVRAELLRETGSTSEAARAHRDFGACLDGLRRCLEKDGCRPTLDALLAWSSAGSPGLPPAAEQELRDSLYLRITRPLPLYMRGVSELWLGERHAARAFFHTYLMLLPEPDPRSMAQTLLATQEPAGDVRESRQSDIR